MRVIWNRLMHEPALVFAIPTVFFGAAAGVWTEPWLGFAAAVSAGVGAVFTRSNVTPTNGKDS